MLSMMKIHSNSIRARNINESLNESSLYDPQNIAFDLLGNLWVADSYNNRVLMYKADRIHPNRFHNGQPANVVIDQPANVVIGQPDFTTNRAPNPPNRSSLNTPNGIAFDVNQSMGCRYWK